MGKAEIRFFFFFILLTCASLSLGQDAIFSQHFSTPSYLNPAFVGSSDCTRLVFNYRNSPFPDFGTFSTFNFSYDQSVDALMGGVGILVTSDHQGGLIMRNHISGIYSLHIRLSRDLHLNFGAQVGYLRKDLNWDNLIFPDQFDPGTGEIIPDVSEIPNMRVSLNAADFGAGILVYSEWFYGGASIHHLTRPEESLFDTYPLPRKFTAHLGFHIPLKRQGPAYLQERSFFISPNIIYQCQEPFHRINYGLYAGISKFAAGIWVRQGFRLPETLIFMLGLNPGNYLVAYSYDHSLSGYTDLFHGTHEISVSLNLNCRPRNLRYRILNCPTF